MPCELSPHPTVRYSSARPYCFTIHLSFIIYHYSLETMATRIHTDTKRWRTDVPRRRLRHAPYGFALRLLLVALALLMGGGRVW